jgi:hypothetical protein
VPFRPSGRQIVEQLADLSYRSITVLHDRICAATHDLEDRMMRPHGKISARVLSMRGDARGWRP